MSDWQRLLELLQPHHAQAAMLARRLSRCAADGDDLFQEAVLRAYRKLPGLRDPARFKAWFLTLLLSIHRNRARRSFWRRFLPLERGGEAPEDGAIGEDGSRWDEQRRSAARMAGALAGPG